jgi:hypothetical protein
MPVRFVQDPVPDARDDFTHGGHLRRVLGEGECASFDKLRMKDKRDCFTCGSQ